MTQDEINEYVQSLADAGISADDLVAMKDLIEALDLANVTPSNIALLLGRAELSLLASAAALAIQQHDAETAQIEAQRATMRDSLVTALINAQTAFVQTTGG